MSEPSKTQTSTKQQKMHRIKKIVIGSALIALIMVSAPFITILVLAFFMFDSNCREDSRPVALMRSLSQQQLAELNSRFKELEKEYPYSQLTNHREPFIPDDLEYLDARYINTGDYIVLAKCNVSVGITVFFKPSRNGEDTIELRWDNANAESPYGTGSEILWTSD